MPDPITSEQFRREILNVIEECFERHHGIFLDKGTTFFETLAPVTAEEASRPASGRSATVAAHVEHAAFYLRVLQKAIRKEPLGALDWGEIWRKAKPVSSAEWDALRDALREEYGNVVALLNAPETWESGESLWGSIAIAIHTSYHLGAVRQILAVVTAE